MSLCPQAAGSLGTARCHRRGLLCGGVPGGGPAPGGWRRDGEAPSQGTGWVRRSPQSDSAGREVVIGCGVSAHRLVPRPGQGMPPRPAVPCLRPPSRPPVSHHCLCEEELCLRVTPGATEPLPAGVPLPLGHRATLTGSSFLFHCQRSTSLPGRCPSILGSLAGYRRATLCTRRGEDPLAPQGTPQRGMPGHFPEPLCSLGSRGTVLFLGAPHTPLAGGVRGTRASFLGSPSWSSPARTQGGAVLHHCSSRIRARIDRLHLWDLP